MQNCTIWNIEKIKRWTVNNARNLKLSICQKYLELHCPISFCCELRLWGVYNRLIYISLQLSEAESKFYCYKIYLQVFSFPQVMLHQWRSCILLRFCSTRTFNVGWMCWLWKNWSSCSFCWKIFFSSLIYWILWMSFLCCIWEIARTVDF